MYSVGKKHLHYKQHFNNSFTNHSRIIKKCRKRKYISYKKKTLYRASSMNTTQTKPSTWSYNWLNVEQLIKFDRSVMAYKIMNMMCPESLWDKFPQISLHSNYNARNCKDIQIPRYNLEYVEKGCHFSALTAWNSIPLSTREPPTLPQFKRNLKTHLKSGINIKYDSPEEQQIGPNFFSLTFSLYLLVYIFS